MTACLSTFKNMISKLITVVNGFDKISGADFSHKKLSFYIRRELQRKTATVRHVKRQSVDRIRLVR